MASPFRIFRKHQKRLLAVVGVLTILSFVFIPIFLEIGGSSRAPADKVVVSTGVFGNLHESELRKLLDQRQSLRDFLERIQAEVQGKGAQPYMTGMAGYLVQRMGLVSEENTVTTWLMAKEAERQGIVVDGISINDMLNQITERKLGSADVQAILRNQRLSEETLFAALRMQMLAMRLETLFSVSAVSTTPAQRWDYYQRLNRKAKIEMAALPVASFVEKVAEPDEVALQEFFEKYKKAAALPYGATPGFRIPPKVALEYFQVDYAKLSEATQVSDEEVAKYYEEHKEQYKRTKFSDTSPAAPAAAEKAAPSEPAQSEPAKSEPAQSEPAPSPEANKAAEPAAPAKQGSSARPASPFQLASYQQEEKPAEASAAAEPPAQPQTPAPSVSLPTLEGAAAPAAEAASPPAEYRPLEEVREEIRRVLVRQKVEQKLEELLFPVQEKLADYQTAQAIYETERRERQAQSKETKGQEGKEEAPLTMPERPDFAKLAEGTPLEVHRTELLSPFELADLSIGKSYVRQTPFYQYAFDKNFATFNPISSVDVEGNRYLAWKTEETEERVPQFDETGMREQVVRAWKLVQAKSLATKEAENLAKEAHQANKSLKDFFAGREGITVSEPEPFSWMTFGSLPPMAWGNRPPQLSEVKGAEYAGQRFMQAVFRLSVGDVGVALDEPETTVYLVRPEEFSPLEAVLQKEFEAASLRSYASAGMSDIQQFQRDWWKGIYDGAGVKWERDPVQARERNRY